jgi:hypothetical protein
MEKEKLQASERFILERASSIIEFDLLQDFLYGEEGTSVYINAEKLKEALLSVYILGKKSNSTNE